MKEMRSPSPNWPLPEDEWMAYQCQILQSI
jgi:hypothetical protein